MLRKKLLPLFLLFLVGIVATSCKEKRSNSRKVRSIGNTSEILVVVQNEEQWENQIGKTIKATFGSIQYGLSQGETLFKLSHVKAKRFNQMFQKHHNILIVNIVGKAKKPKVELSKNLWSKPQRVYTITAPSVGDFVKVFKKFAPSLITHFRETEHERILSIFRPDNDLRVVKNVRDQFGLKMVIPKGFYVAKTKHDFMWIRRKAESFTQALVFISEPYKDTTQFTVKSIVARTDNYLQRFIPGPTNGSFMSIDHKFVLPKADVVTDFFTDYAVEVRGLWRVEHDFMGGPFVSYTFVDWRKNKIVTIMGYVYQPNKPKRNLLLQLESIIYSARFADAKKLPHDS